jgi:cytochrome c biogenesis protein CcmG, thiol:disulfide interchange protein DsbE
MTMGAHAERRTAAGIVVAAAIVTTLVAGGCQRNGGGSLVGSPAPEFSLADLKGNAVRLANLKGKVVFVNLWTTWCEPCRQEMPAMQALYDQLAGPDFVMLAVSADQSQRDVVEKFVATYKLTFPVLPDPDLQIANRYKVTGYPETFVIDRNGMVVAHEIGPRHWDAPKSLAAFKGLIEGGTWAGL